MLKLKDIINQLEVEKIGALKDLLMVNKANSLLYLLEEYEKDVLTDEEIIEHLGTSISSFYSLKSRLYDKIKSQLIDDSTIGRNDILSQLENIPNFCYKTPRELAETTLLQLEHILKTHNMSDGLIMVYSALKKIYLHTNKFYEYSQRYNEHLAYLMVLEKAQEFHGRFIFTLSDYNVSKLPIHLDFLKVIKKEMTNILLLNKSPHLQIINNIMVIHIQLFTNIILDDEDSTDDLLKTTCLLLEDFQKNDLMDVYITIVTFLNFEYYFKIKEYKKAQKYFDEINHSMQDFLLLDDLCLANHFLLSKILVYCNNGIEYKLHQENNQIQFLSNKDNVHTQLFINMYLAISSFYGKEYDKCLQTLNSILNTTSFKELLHTEIEVKLFLAYVYVLQKEYDLASNAVRSIYRKIKGQNNSKYDNALAFSKIISLLIKNNGRFKMKNKILSAIKIFEFENSNGNIILEFLNKELNNLKTKLAS